jgi:hypothetical protein
VRYVVDALAGADPAQRADGIPWAEPFPVEREELERAVDRLDAWTREPRW